MYYTKEANVLSLAAFGGLSMRLLLDRGIIVPYGEDNKPWRNTILPQQDTATLGNLITSKPYGGYTHRLQASLVPRSAFGLVDLLDGADATFDETRGVLGEDGLPHPVLKRYIAREVGDYVDSVKRYKDLEDPLSMRLPGWERYVSGVTSRYS